MKRFFFISVLFISTPSFAQTQFVSMFSSGLGFGAGIQQALDSSFVFAGTGGSPRNWNLTKTDNAGNLLWSKSYGGTLNDECQDVEITADGGFIMAGRVQSYGEPNGDAALMKTDAAGNVQWLKTYGGTTSYDQFAKVKEFPTGGYVAVGLTASYGANVFNAYAVRTNSIGDTLWTYVFQASSLFHSFGSLVINNNGDITIVGETSFGFGGGATLLLIKLDSLGNEKWKYDYNSSSQYTAIDFTSNKDAYYISTDNNSDAAILKIDTAGNVIWRKGYHVGPGSDQIDIIHTLPNNQGLLGTYRRDDGGVYKTWAIKLDTAGNVIWTKEYATCNSSAAFGILNTYDGGIALIEVDGGMNATALIKTDNLGNTNLPCLEVNLTTITTSSLSSRIIGGTRTYGAIVGSPIPPVTILTPKNEFYSCNPDTADFSWLSYTQCTFDSTVFTSSYTTHSGFPTGFVWDFGDGNTSTLENPNHLYAAAGTYNVQLIVNWGCTADTVNKSITIVSGSAPSFGFYTNPNDTICNSSVSYIFQSLTADSIIVDFGDGTSIFNVSNNTLFTTHSYVPGTYSLIGVAYNSCGTDTILDTITVILNPVANFNLVSSNFCLGQSNSFTNTTVIGILPVTNWLWEFGDGNTSNQQNPSYAYPSEGTYNVTLTATDAFGCSNSITQQITLTADNSIASINYSVGCPCTDFSFNSIGTATAWNWSFGDGSTNTLQNPNYSYSLPGQYYVSVIGTNSSGCSFKDQIVIDVCPNDTLYTSKSNNNWYFYDKTGVSFSTGGPVANTMGQMASVPGFFAQYTSEGCATMSNANNGNLLFYANGNNVWDANHNLMTNGTGLNGDVSYSQGTVIVPMPGNSDKYYVFTSRETGDTSVYYSIIDMTLNGGLGDVEVANKNVLLTSFNGSEAMSATIKTNPQCNADAEYWLVIPKDSVVYEVFLIDNSGITLNGTYSFSVPSTFTFFSNMNIWGNSAFSPNGSKYVKSIISQGFLLYDFNTTTGVLSNQTYFINTITSSNYDYEFSPNGQFLYSSGSNGIKRYDITASDILSTHTSLSTTNTGTMWKGDDGNIYAPQNGSTFLCRINNPNLGTSTVTNNAVSLLGRTTYLGLQNIVKLNISVQDTSFASFTATVNCLAVNFTNTSDTLNYTDPCSFLANNDTLLNYYWDFGDGNTSTQWSPSHTYLVNGNYTVQLVVKRPFMCTSDTMTQTINVASCCVSASQFVKTYGEGEANWVIQTSDCGFMIAGHTTASGAGGWDAYLIRTDANGNLLWSKTYGGVSNDEFKTVEETTDGGFIAFGQALSFGAGGGDMYLVKTDANRVMQWSKTYGGPEWDWGFQVKQLPDDGYILTGQTFSYEQVTVPVTVFDGYVIRTNSLGDTLWTTTLHANNSWFGNSIMGVELNAAGNFIVGGVTQTTNHQSWLVELDGATGAIVWSKDYDIGAYSESYYPHQLPNGNYAYAGFTQNSIFGGTDFILKETNNTGNIQWAKVYGGTGNDVGRDMELTSDGGFILSGKTNSYGYGGTDFMLMKLDAFGTPKWTKTYGGCNNETVATVVQTTDNGYALVGNTESLGNMANATNIILIKTDSLGNSGLTCFETNPNVSSQNVNLTVNNGAVQINAGIVNTINAQGVAALIDTITPNCIFTADFVADSVCFNNVTSFTDSSSTDIHPCSWAWNFDDLASGGSNTSTLQNPTHTFTASGTFNVILTTTWMGAVDSITIPVIVHPIYSIPLTQTICTGDSILLGGAYQTTAGIYTDSLLTVSGCDSIITTTLTVNTIVISNQIATICQGDSILLGGAFQTIAGVYADTTFGGSFTSCDSITSTSLTVNPSYLVPQAMSICQGDSALIGSIYYNTSGIYDDSLATALGCDSIIQVTLTVNPLPISTATASICQGDSILLGGAYQNTAGIYNDTIFGGGFSGCDSLVATTLTINPLPTSTATASICQGDSILLGGSFQFVTGVYNDTIFGGSVLGCDSIFSTTLTVSPIGDATITPVNAMCSGDLSIVLSAISSGGVWSGNGITNTNTGDFDPSIAGVGLHQIIYTISGACGDADTININVNPSPTTSINTVDDNCEEDIGEIDVTLLTGIPPIVYNWNNGATTSSLTNLSAGIYTLIIADSTGCTSTYQVTINDLAIDCQFNVYLPNVFSPNGDGENDVLYVRGKGVQSVHMVIYNRWGNKVFETTSMNNGWNGTYHGQKQNPAVFVYYINATFTNGQTVTNKGNISIVK